MNFFKPKDLDELYSKINVKKENRYFLAGGTDINIQIRKGIIENPNIVFINHLPELKMIFDDEKFIHIGTNITFTELLESDLIKNRLPYFHSSLKRFASPILQTTATIGGNIGNCSPTADSIPLLLALKAKLVLASKEGERTVDLKDYFTGYKKTILKYNEIIKEIIIPKDGEEKRIGFYKKVGSRKSLTIAKAAVAIYFDDHTDFISNITIAAGSLNEYARRLFTVENYLEGKSYKDVSISELEKALSKDITPISDLRSDDKYRFKVTLNLILTSLNKVID